MLCVLFRGVFVLFMAVDYLNIYIFFCLGIHSWMFEFGVDLKRHLDAQKFQGIFPDKWIINKITSHLISLTSLFESICATFGIFSL